MGHSLDYADGYPQYTTSVISPTLRPWQCSNARCIWLPPAMFHISGVHNILGDVASHVVASVASYLQHLLEHLLGAMCPNTFLTISKSTYPLPQKRPWNNVQPYSALWSRMVLTL